MRTEKPRRPRVAVIGAGFGGIWAAKHLANKPVDVVVVDKNNYHTFYPLLYQVAAAEVEPEHIVYPVRSILHKIPNAQFVMEEITQIDTEAKLLKTKHTDIWYDYLIISAGSVTNFFGTPGADKFAYPLREMDEAIELRNHILKCFEGAILTRDEEKRKRLLTFVIVGGGPTGVEYAGALAELIYRPLVKDYPNIDFNEVKLILLEAESVLIPGILESYKQYPLDRLEDLRVDVRLNSRVTEVTHDDVKLADGTVIPTETVVWTAGVKADDTVKAWGFATAKGGRIAVEPTLQVPDHPNIFAIGDTAYLEQDGKPLPMVAPVAIQQAKIAAENVLAAIEGQTQKEFRYKDPGTMLTIGRNAGVAEIKGRGFTGFIAWLLWLGVHLFKLIGFRNRILVLFNWALDYFFYERTVRLILR
jgi:NADH dehydrogenase